MHTQTDQSLHVGALHVKLAHGAAMTQVSHLDLDTAEGVRGDRSPAGRCPRQICVAREESLLACGVKPGGSRANIILHGPARLASGCVLTINETVIRITFACEPCAHGARLAETPMRTFRQIDRYLGVITRGGRLEEDDAAVVRTGVFAAAPDDFRSRCRWALDFIPPGDAVTSLEFLNAVGASRSYLRALPRWLHAARATGGPVHRVLTSHMREPSWAPTAYADLAAEGGKPTALEPFALVDALWFADDGDSIGSWV